MDLQAKFHELLLHYTSNKSLIPIFWNELNSQYSHKSRFYHNWRHIEKMLLDLPLFNAQIENLDALVLSIFYHDSIYRVTKNNNEEKSADLLQEHLCQTNFKKIAWCKDQIIATKQHKFSDNTDTNILIDLDLSILGQPLNVYQEYAQNIRKEYGIYPSIMYNPGRKKALKHILNQDSMYKTESFKERYESKARKNLTWEINSL